MDTTIVRDQFHPPLTKEELETMKKENQTNFPKTRVIRKDTDPSMVEQQFGCVSFVVFKEPKKTKDGICFGLFKLRGNYRSEKECDERSSLIIREVDSANKILICPVGNWLPLTNDMNFCSDVLDVKTESDEEVPVHLRDQVAKDKESEQNKIKKDLLDRVEQLQSNTDDIYSDKESLRYYTMKRVTERVVREEVENTRKKLEEMQKKLGEVRTELKYIQGNHSEYSDQWVEMYNTKRREVGMPDFRLTESELKEYNKNLESL